MSQDWGGYWTEAKLDVLGKYLNAFNVACKTWGQTIYLDLFAGKLVNTRPDTHGTYPGSTAHAMDAEPAFTRLVFWELSTRAQQLRDDLKSAYPTDTRSEVIEGDCNKKLDEGLELVKAYRSKPTFAFIDPKGLNVQWSTLARLSEWRQSSYKTELWILLPEAAMPRVLGLDGVHGQHNAERITKLYGCDDWIAIHEGRLRGALLPEQARAEYVNLLRWRLEKELKYKHTHALGLGNVNNAPIYTMIFATDNDTGEKIMGDIYQMASVRDIPALRGQAQAHRVRQRQGEVGIMPLFEMAPTVASTKYVHVDPWAPPERKGEALTLDPSDDGETLRDQ